ncbi:MAG: metal-dependent transcriptional regulator [archaeon GB-1867-005]|nr:metal-dependent transcriptional regulator [Candidatus Culexmicrobium cathedralense]
MNITKREAEYLLMLFKEEAYCSKYISSVKVAKKLQVAPSTAVEALKKLAEKGFVKYIKRRGVQLTCEGLKIARKLVRRHRILEVLIVKIAEVDVDTACSMIRGLEFEVNDELMELLNDALGKPRCCPHGYEIPEV